jgi:hypothetical protein
MTAEAYDTEEREPEHPDRQHEPPAVVTEDPVDFEPGEGRTDGGELPAEIPDAEG